MRLAAVNPTAPQELDDLVAPVPRKGPVPASRLRRRSPRLARGHPPRALDRSAGGPDSRGSEGAERRGASLRRHEPGAGPGVLLRRHRRGDPQRPGAARGAARDGANLVVRLQGQAGGRAGDRPPARGRRGARGQRAQGRGSRCASPSSSSTWPTATTCGRSASTAAPRTSSPIQDEISLGVVEKLKVKLLAGESGVPARRHEPSQEAYHLYLKGRYFLHRRGPGDIQRAIEHFEKAIAADPAYAVPHLGIAETFSVLGIWGFLPPRQALGRGKAAARAGDRAGRLARRGPPEPGDASSSSRVGLGRGASAHFERAGTFLPVDRLGSSRARPLPAGPCRRTATRPCEVALRAVEDGAALVHRPHPGGGGAHRRWATSRAPSALLDKALELDAGMPMALLWLGYCRGVQGRLEEAVDAAPVGGRQRACRRPSCSCRRSWSGPARRTEARTRRGRPSRSAAAERYVSPLGQGVRARRAGREGSERSNLLEQAEAERSAMLTLCPHRPRLPGAGAGLGGGVVRRAGGGPSWPGWSAGTDGAPGCVRWTEGTEWRPDRHASASESPTPTCCASGATVLVDPGGPTNGAAGSRKVLPRLGDARAALDLMVVTHGHFDHVAAAIPLREATGRAPGRAPGGRGLAARGVRWSGRRASRGGDRFCRNVLGPLMMPFLRVDGRRARPRPRRRRAGPRAVRRDGSGRATRPGHSPGSVSVVLPVRRGVRRRPRDERPAVLPEALVRHLRPPAGAGARRAGSGCSRWASEPSTPPTAARSPPPRWPPDNSPDHDDYRNRLRTAPV